MITKGFIEEIIDDSSVKVRCPTLDSVKGSNKYVKNLSSAVVCTIPSASMHFNIGDVVFVGFEHRSRSKPIVLGYLHKTIPDKSYMSIESNSVCVTDLTKLSSDTTIGSVNYTHLVNFSGTSSNAQEQLNYLNDSINMLKSSATGLNQVISGIEQLIDSIDKSCESNSFEISEIKKIVGDDKSDDLSTVYGKLNACLKDLIDIDNSIGIVPKNNNLVSMLQKINDDAGSVFNIVESAPFSNGTQASGMLGRAEKMVNVAWTAKTTFESWNQSVCYEKGNTYIGMPYTQSGEGYSYDAWLKNSDKNCVVNLHPHWGPKYGSCCADFVSETLGLPTILRTVSSLLSETKYLTQLSGPDAKASNIRVGDVMISATKGHAIWVGGLSDGNITIYEQTPSIENGRPLGARKTTYKLSEHTSANGYFYKYINSEYVYICRPTEALLTLPANKTSGSDTITIKGDGYAWSYDFTDKVLHKLAVPQMEANAIRIACEMQKKGWSFNAICALLGNIDVDCRMNPDQGGNSEKAFGLLQWSPASYYHTSMQDKLSLCETYTGIKKWRSNASAQCTVIDQMYRRGQGNWKVKSGKSNYGMPNDLDMTFEEFITSNKDIDLLTSVFCAYALRPKGNGNYSKRREEAHKWKNFLIRKFGKISD